MQLLGLIFGGVICVLVSSFGFIIKRKYKVNSDFMAAYVDFLAYTKAEIANNKTPVFEIIDGYIERENNLLTKVLCVINNNLKKDIVDTENYPKECVLVDKKIIKALIADIESIGKYDSSTEVLKLNSIEERAKAKAATAATKYKKDGVMAFKLAVLIGIAIMIILA